MDQYCRRPLISIFLNFFYNFFYGAFIAKMKFLLLLKNFYVLFIGKRNSATVYGSISEGVSWLIVRYIGRRPMAKFVNGPRCRRCYSQQGPPLYHQHTFPKTSAWFLGFTRANEVFCCLKKKAFLSKHNGWYKYSSQAWEVIGKWMEMYYYVIVMRFFCYRGKVGQIAFFRRNRTECIRIHPTMLFYMRATQWEEEQKIVL